MCVCVSIRAGASCECEWERADLNEHAMVCVYVWGLASECLCVHASECVCVMKDRVSGKPGSYLCTVRGDGSRRTAQGSRVTQGPESKNPGGAP